MKKTVTYRRAANKLRTRNRDLSRSKETTDRRFGNNGSVSSLGVRYRDSDGDGYKDKITKTRRPSSLVRDASYGGSQPMAGAYSRAVANSASPNTTQEFENAVAGREYTAAQLESWSDLADQNLVQGNYVDTYWEPPAGGVRLDMSEGAWGTDVTLHPITNVSVNSAILSITLHSAVSEDIIIYWGTDDGSINGKDILRVFGNDVVAAPGTGIWGGTYLFFAWQNNANFSGPHSAGTTLTREIAGLGSSQIYYARWVIQKTVNVVIPSGYTSAGETTARSMERNLPAQKLTTLAS